MSKRHFLLVGKKNKMVGKRHLSLEKVGDDEMSNFGEADEMSTL
jgi:hypothetical protein